MVVEEMLLLVPELIKAPAGRVAKDDLLKRLLTRTKPVSYTHLDVYKRQNPM